MKKGIWIVAAVLAVSLFVSCGGDSDEVLEPAETAQPTSEPTPEPTLEATPEPTPEPTPEATPEPTPDTVSEMVDDAGSMEGCPAGGMLTDAEQISACNIEAMMGIDSFSFEAEINLMAAFSSEADSGEGAVSISGDVVLPDSISFRLSMAAEGETMDAAVRMIGTDTYFQDPTSGLWFKGSPPDAESLSMVQMVGMMYLPNEPGATLKETIELDDGTKAYLLDSVPGGQQSGLGGLGFPGGSVTRVVGADDFLTTEVRIGIEGMDGGMSDIITIRYFNFHEPLTIGPPDEYMEIPDEWMDQETTETGLGDALTVVGLARNADGDVEVTFSEPVFVQGEVGLYVLDPQTGGWDLPLLGGSGTDTLTFDADPEGTPSLIVGESQIAGITFPSIDSEIANAAGDWPILDFEPWTYE